MIWLRLAVSLLVVLLLAAGLTWWRAASREAAARERWPAEGRAVLVEGQPLQVVVAGPSDGSVPDLVLIHGASGSGRDYTFHLVGQLSGRYRVFVPDRPGFGASPPQPGSESLADQARLISAAVAQLGARKPVVLGQSYGGAVALAWAEALPDSLSALVVVSAPSHPWSGSRTGFWYRLATPFGQHVLVPLIAAWVPDSFLSRAITAVFAPNPAPAGFADWFGPALSMTRTTLATNARQRRALMPELVTMVPGYARIAVPVEIVHGEADDTVPIAIHSEPLAAEIPGAVLTRLPGIGHMPHHSAEAEVIAAIDRAAARAGAR